MQNRIAYEFNYVVYGWGIYSVTNRFIWFKLSDLRR